MSLVLVGFMGTGKNTVGKILSSRLGWPFVDTDAQIEARAGKPITRIFSEDGEATFRTQETAVLSDLVASGSGPRVIATGGGIVMAERNWPLLRRLGKVVCLTADSRTIQRRVGTADDRPLLAGSPDEVRCRIDALLSQRQAAYAQADQTIDTSRLTPEAVAESIVVQLRQSH